ncbi:BQ5605_C006g03804 [Microbotryum silenes-dioicae]|uniref:BQ5605_C006g03804 protein n=1 Tax=Microbotryum silenes-dioicae TaxID=796604 RepID=A0A2X0M9A3_9BASI|nr:BQ5605_C006g03804 [Microbotryum silenes-dioicae]
MMRTRSSSVAFSLSPPPPRSRGNTHLKAKRTRPDATSSTHRSQPTKYWVPSKLLQARQGPVPARQSNRPPLSSSSSEGTPSPVKKAKAKVCKGSEKRQSLSSSQTSKRTKMTPPAKTSSPTPLTKSLKSEDFPARLDSDAPLYFKFLKQHNIIAATLTKHAPATKKGKRNPTYTKKCDNALYEVKS